MNSVSKLKINMVFQSTTSVFLTYLILKAAPIVAVVYYFFDAQWAGVSAIVLLLLIFFYSGRTNHHFSLDAAHLTIYPSLFFWMKNVQIPYSKIHSIEIKYAVEKDNRQWLHIHFHDENGQEKFKKYRCDWLHTQDPPDDDESHEVPDNELFEILKDEDFYEGSLNQLADELMGRKVRVI